jgi:uncharacterized membrane protein
MIKHWIEEVKDFIEANFRHYFWYFVVYIAGIITAGFFTFLEK